MVSRSVSFGPTTTAADVKGTIGSAYTFANSGTIKKIIVVQPAGVAAKPGSSIVYLEFKRLAGPFEFACAGYGGLTDVYPLPANVIDVDLPYTNGEVVTVSMKSSEIALDVIISLTCVE